MFVLETLRFWVVDHEQKITDNGESKNSNCVFGAESDKFLWREILIFSI